MFRSQISFTIHTLCLVFIFSFNCFLSAEAAPRTSKNPKTVLITPTPAPTLSPGQVSERVQGYLTKAAELKLWDEREWRLLGYYDRRLLGNLKSRGTRSFFLSEDGETNPRAELEATIQNLFETRERPYIGSAQFEEKQIPRCQFPARYRWITKRLSIQESELPLIECAGLNQFRARMGGKAAAIVFSSFYMNNPSSSFGHSLLRVSKISDDSPNSEKLELLDFGVGYAADQTTPNPLFYALYGIAGVFRGTYTNIPYYYKVREYNDFESRDLWSYHLNLTDEEKTMLVDRIWEVGSTFHYYYYFTLNCSNVILHAVETAAPRFHILDELKYYVIPSDTIKAMMKVPGLVSKVTYRPSAYSIFQKRIDGMSAEELSELHRVIDAKFDPEALTAVPKPIAVSVLDSAADYIDYKYAKDVVIPAQPTNEKGEAQKVPDAVRWRQNVLLARASIPERSRSFKDFIPTEQRPDLGHGSMKVSLLGGRESGLSEAGQPSIQNYAQLNVRFALHDILDPQIGYPTHSHLEMIAFKLRRMSDSHRLELEDLNFLRIMNLQPLTSFSRSISWRAEVGGKRIRDENCSRCFATAIEFGGGYAIEPVRGVVFYGMGEFGLRHAPSFAGSDLQPALGPVGGALVQFGPFGLHATAKYKYGFFTPYPNTRIYSGEFRYNLSQKIALSLDARKYAKAWDTSASLGVFF